MNSFVIINPIKLPSSEWGDVRVSVVPVIDGSWGILEPLRNTPWSALIPIIPGAIMAEARHGHIKPLMQIIGRPPYALMKLIPDDFRICADCNSCASFRAVDCHPCSTLPDCYTPPKLHDVEAEMAARLVALAWRDGNYVVIVDGPEFSL